MHNLIWLFREARTGSGWALQSLSSSLNKTVVHYDLVLGNRNVKEETYFELYNQKNLLSTEKRFEELIKQETVFDTDRIYSSHFMFLLSKLNNQNTYVLRTTRRNKIDQCVSLLYLKYYPRIMKQYFVDESKNLNLNYFNHTINNPVEVSKKDVIDCLSLMKTHDDLWKKYSGNFKNYTIVYEDCEQGINIPNLDAQLKFSNFTGFTKKIPEYKTKVFTNYDMIVSWCEEFIDKNPFIIV